MRPVIHLAALKPPLLDLRNIEYVGRGNFRYKTKCGKVIPMKEATFIAEGGYGYVELITFKNKKQVIVKEIDANDSEIKILQHLNSKATSKHGYAPCGIIHGKLIYKGTCKAIIAMQVMDGDLLDQLPNLHEKDILKIIDRLIGINICLRKLRLVYTDMKWENVLYKKMRNNRMILALGDFDGVAKLGCETWTRTFTYPHEGDTLKEIDAVWSLWCTMVIALVQKGKNDNLFDALKKWNERKVRKIIEALAPKNCKSFLEQTMDGILSGKIKSFKILRSRLKRHIKGGQTTPKPITPGFVSTTDLSKITINKKGQVFFDTTLVTKKKIGEGKFGKVFRVDKPEPFVLKEIAVKNSQEELAFLNAVKKYKKLLNQNIPCNMVNGRLVLKSKRYAYVAMDAMDDTLKALVQKTCLTSMEILNIALHTCRMLVCLKQLGYYYTDIKLNNMLYKETPDGAIYLVLGDYGSLSKQGSREFITSISHPERSRKDVVSDRDVLYPFLWMIAKCFPRPKALTCQLTLTYPKGALQRQKKWIKYTNLKKEKNWIFNSDYMRQKVPQRIANYYGKNGNLRYLNSKTLEELEDDLSKAVAEHVLSAGEEEDDLAPAMEGMSLEDPSEGRVRNSVKRFEDEFQKLEDLSIELESASGDIDGSSGIESNSADEDEEGDLSMVVGDESMEQNSGDSREIEEAVKDETEEPDDQLSLVSDEPEPDLSNSRSVDEDTPGSLVDFIVDDDESLPSCFDDSGDNEDDGLNPWERTEGLTEYELREWRKQCARQKLQNIVNYDPCCNETGDSREIEEASERETTAESVGDLDYSWMYD